MSEQRHPLAEDRAEGMEVLAAGSQDRETRDMYMDAARAFRANVVLRAGLDVALRALDAIADREPGKACMSGYSGCDGQCERTAYHGAADARTAAGDS